MISAIKEQAFEALKRLSPSNSLDLSGSHQKGMIFLYRLLFILYAESHQILPITNPEYFEHYSLQKIRLDIQANPIKPTPTTNFHWNRVKELVSLINGTRADLNKTLGVPRFNGGLFSPERHVFLEIGDVDDVDLKEAIKSLSQNKEGQLFDYCSLTINQLGSIYEGLLDYQTRKLSGSFYTPLEIVKYMSQVCLRPIFTRLRVEATTNHQLDIKRYHELILNLKILDPAVGCGHFLIGMAESIVKELMLDQEKSSTEGEEVSHHRYLQRIITDTILGVDLDSIAVELTEAALWLIIVPQQEIPSLINNSLKLGNALLGTPLKDLNYLVNEVGNDPIQWDLEFPAIFKRDNPGFDLIIGNPPYLNAITMRDQMPMIRDILKENYKFLNQKWDIYIAFIEKSLQLLRDGGILSFIIPSAFLSEKYAKQLQKYLVKTYRILQIDYFPRVSIFEGIGIHNIILTVQKEQPTVPVLKVFHRDLEGVVERKEIKKYDQIFTDFFEDTIKIDETNFYSLGDIAYISTGIVFNAKEPEFKGEFKKKDLISTKASSIHSRKLLEGGNVFPYEIRGHRYVEWGSDRVPRKIRRPTFEELHQANKLVSNKLGALKVALDEEGLVCDQTVRVVIKWEQLHGVVNPSINKALKKARRERQDLESISHRYNYYLLLALLNSKACRYFFYKLRTEHSIDINPDVLRQIPVPIIKPTDQAPIIESIHLLLTNVQKIKKNRFDNSQDEIQARLQQLDLQFYALYRFTPDQIQIVEKFLKNY